MIRLEFLFWLRSKRFLIMLAIFIFSGFTSPLFSYYSNEIINGFGNVNNKIMISSPEWEDLIKSYFKNTSQLVLFISAYIVADRCRLGKDKALQLFYTTRAKNAWRILLPKVIVSLIITCVSSVVGALTTLYVTWVIFDDFVYSLATKALLIQICGILIFITWAALISYWINSPFITSIFIEGLIMSAIFFNFNDEFQAWSPTGLLSPIKIFQNETVTYENWIQIVSSVIVCFILLGLTFFKPLRKNTKIENGNDRQ